MTRFPRNWPGIHPSAWPALNRLAQAIETALNWRTDGSLQVQQAEGSMYGAVPPPPEFLGIIMGGNQPYSFAKLTPDNLGEWFGENADGPLIGHCANQSTGTVVNATAVGNTATIYLIEDLSSFIAVGQTVVIAGINPTEYGGYYSGATGTNPSTGQTYAFSGGVWPQGGYSCDGYNGLFKVSAVLPNVNGGSVFQIVLCDSPPPYVFGGNVCFWNTGDVNFRAAYEENGNTGVPVGAVVRMYPRLRCNYDIDPNMDMEFRFQWGPKFSSVTMSGVGRMKPQSPAYNTASFFAPLYVRSLVQQGVARNLSSNVNNYNVDQTTGGVTTPALYNKMNVTSNMVMSGISSTNAVDGTQVVMINVGTAIMAMPHQSTSASQNQLSTIDGKTVYLNPGDTVSWKYNTTTSKWTWYWGLCPGQTLRQHRKDISSQALSNTAGVNNTVAIPPTSSWYITPGGNSKILGMTEYDGNIPQDGRRILMKNDTGVGSGITITLPNQSSGTSPGTQFSAAQNTILQAQESVWVEYKASNLNNTGGWVPEKMGNSSQSNTYIQYSNTVPQGLVNGSVYINSQTCQMCFMCQNTTTCLSNTTSGGSGGTSGFTNHQFSGTLLNTSFGFQTITTVSNGGGIIGGMSIENTNTGATNAGLNGQWQCSDLFGQGPTNNGISFPNSTDKASYDYMTAVHGNSNNIGASVAVPPFTTIVIQGQSADAVVSQTYTLNDVH
jgi:hypothetical protein